MTSDILARKNADKIRQRTLLPSSQRESATVYQRSLTVQFSCPRATRLSPFVHDLPSQKLPPNGGITRYYVDPSIAAAALGIGPNDLINDLKTFGFLFETLCIRDLRVFADALNGAVYHYRDKDGQECDAVIHLRNGKYGLVEIKLGGDSLIEEGAKSLKAMAEKIDTDKMNAPAFLMVLTGTGDFAYRRPDGVCVVPIGCLKN